MSELTARRKADRATMAHQVADLAHEYGLTAWQTSQPEVRGVEVSGPHGLRVAVKFDGRRAARPSDVYVLSWYGVEDGVRLHWGMFNHVNPHHGHKATDVAHGFAQLLRTLRERFAVIENGSAFILAREGLASEPR